MTPAQVPRSESGTRKTLLVVYHTMTGGTGQMAQAAAEGARDEPGVQVRLLHAPQAQPEDVLSADGYVFATPENLAAMAGSGPVHSICRGANVLNRASIEAPAAARIDMRARRVTTSGARLGPFPCGVAAKKAMRRVTKPCRGSTPAAFRALRMTFLTSNASPANSVNRP